MSGKKRGLPSLNIFKHRGISIRFFMRLRPSQAHKGLQELNNLEWMEKRRRSVEMPSQGRQRTGATFTSFPLLQKFNFIFQSLNTVIGLHKKNERGLSNLNSETYQSFEYP